MGICRDRSCFCEETAGDGGMARERDDEVQLRQGAAWVLFAGCGSKTSVGKHCVGEHGGCRR
jgi:hypothetical protein